MKYSIFQFSFLFIFIFTSCSAQTASQKATEIDAQEVTYRNQKFDIVKIDLQKTIRKKYIEIIIMLLF